ncbi:MAG: sugar ABC transporter permease, partial [Anaerolineae bacterium]|nr:sugar ABC transporter permease [Anaerolineae bacterium]
MLRRYFPVISAAARREERIFYLFILPWLIGLVVFSIGPVFGMLGLSFTDWRISLDNLQFVGLENYTKLFSDPIFWTSVGNTLYIVVGRVVFGTSFALLLAILLNQKVPGIPFFRAVYYLPTVTAGVAVALVWIWIFNPRLGILNYTLKQIGIQGPPWIFSKTWVKPSLIIMS